MYEFALDPEPPKRRQVHPRPASPNFKEAFMPNAVRPIPEGYHSITPQITCRDAAKAIDFYKNVFGAVELSRMPDPSGKIMHAELKIGDSRLMLNDEIPGMAVAPAPAPIHLHSLFLYTENVDSVYNRAVKAGRRPDTHSG